MANPKVPQIDPSLLGGVVPPAGSVAKPQAARGERREYSMEDHKKVLAEIEKAKKAPVVPFDWKTYVPQGAKVAAVYAVVKTLVSGAPSLKVNEKTGVKGYIFDIKGYVIKNLLTGKEAVVTPEVAAQVIAAKYIEAAQKGEVVILTNFLVKKGVNGKAPYIQGGGLDPNFKSLHDLKLVEYITEPVLGVNGKISWRVKPEYEEAARRLGYNERAPRVASGAPKAKAKKTVDQMEVMKAVLASMKDANTDKFKDLF